MIHSACIEMLFVAETADPAARLALAKAAGFESFEFWLWSNKDLKAIKSAMADTGLSLSGMVAEPFALLTDRADHQRFLDGLKRSVEAAQFMGTGVLIAQAGNEREGVARSEQNLALTEALVRSAEVLKGSGVVLALEPLNTLVDHAGYYLSSTVEGLDIVDAVGQPEVRLLYDIYHSMVMGEVPSEVTAGRVDRIAHVHIADHPGRTQPGTGGLDLGGAIKGLVREGYRGAIGHEYRPIGPSAKAVADGFASMAL